MKHCARNILVLVVAAGLGFLIGKLIESNSSDVRDSKYVRERLDSVPTPVPIGIDTIVDLGRIGPEKRVAFKIRYSNHGKVPIRIGDMDTFCGCLATDSLYRGYVQPGASSVIHMSYKPTSSGHVEKHIFVYFEPYEQPVEVLLKAKVLTNE